MTDTRVVFDFDITFSNEGGIQGQGFRLDIDDATISDDALAALIVADLRLLMVECVTIINKHYVNEPHKRGATPRVVSLSHTIADGDVTLPGLPLPRITFDRTHEETSASYAEGTEFSFGHLDIAANTGTYIDAPLHRYRDGGDMAAMPVERTASIPGICLTAEETEITETLFAGRDLRGLAVIIRTGWSSKFGDDDYAGPHPYITAAAAQLLVDSRCALVGIDSANIDSVATGERPAHTLLLAAGIPIVEHLTNLDQLPDAGFEFSAAPLPFVGLGTSPVHATARLG